MMGAFREVGGRLYNRIAADEPDDKDENGTAVVGTRGYTPSDIDATPADLKAPGPATGELVNPGPEQQDSPASLKTGVRDEDEWTTPKPNPDDSTFENVRRFQDDPDTMIRSGDDDGFGSGDLDGGALGDVSALDALGDVSDLGDDGFGSGDLHGGALGDVSALDALSDIPDLADHGFGSGDLDGGALGDNGVVAESAGDSGDGDTALD
jgi:hypothetical protein